MKNFKQLKKIVLKKTYHKNIHNFFYISICIRGIQTLLLSSFFKL